MLSHLPVNQISHVIQMLSRTETELLFQLGGFGMCYVKWAAQCTYEKLLIQQNAQDRHKLDLI